MASSAPRIVSLLPAATEIVADLGAAQSLVGRSHECDYPQGIESVPVCTALERKLPAESAAIHADITTLIEQALAIYRVDAERLRALAPDVIITQSQCAVCAVSESDLGAALADWLGAPPTVVSLAPASLGEVAESFRIVAEAIGLPAAGAALASGLLDHIDNLAAKTSQLAARPRVATIEWTAPLMTAGNWVPELVAAAGGENLFGSAGAHSPWLSWGELVAADPEVIVAKPCGFDLPRATAEMSELARRREWAGLHAVRSGRVAVADGNHYFNRPGPRLADSAEILAEILHPEAFAFGHEGEGWRWLGQ